MEHLSNDPKDHPNQQEIHHNLHNEMRHTVLSLLENQWKLRNNMIRISQWRESHCRILASEEINISKKKIIGSELLSKVI